MKHADLKTRLLLAQLWATGECRINRENEKIVKEYAKYYYVTAEGKRVLKRGYKALTTPDGKTAISKWLESNWPGFETEINELRQDRDFDFSVGSYERTRIKLHKDHLPPQRDPGDFANIKTINAVLGIHSKSKNKKNRKIASAFFPNIKYIVADNPLRLKAPQGLELVLQNNIRISIGLETIQRHECILSERVLVSPFRFEGTLPKAVLTVENPAALLDLPRPEYLLILLIPGWNSPLGLKFLKALPANIPIWHFGDFDPDGYKMFEKHRQELDQQVDWFVPSFAEDYLHKADLQGKEKKWQDEETDTELSPFVLKLKQMKSWIEQEVFCFDERMRSELEKICV